MNNQEIISELDKIGSLGLRRSLKNVSSSQGTKIVIDGKEVLNFCSNNYLGLADDFRLREAAVKSIEQEGWGSGASRLVCGNMNAHTQLEQRIARFKGKEACLLFSCGYMANVGIISSLFSREDIIFSDKLNHASIIDGILLSGAQYKRYTHCDMVHLEELLKKYKHEGKKCLIVTDSVFSMDGDLAPLKEIVNLANEYDCMVMIDEAHALGVLGKTGRGLSEQLGVEEEIDITMGTLSKAVGSYGAYCCGAQALVDLLINKARSFIYTTGIPPSVSAASLVGINIIEEDSSLRERLWDNVHYVKKALDQMGWDTLHSQTPIIPLLIKNSQKAVELSQQLLAKGVLISAIRPPTVPQNTARLRLTVMATHQKKELDYLLGELNILGKELNLLTPQRRD